MLTARPLATGLKLKREEPIAMSDIKQECIGRVRVETTPVVRSRDETHSIYSAKEERSI